MYKSPITIIESTIDAFSKTIIEQRENAIFAKIQDSFGVDLDKHELLRALQYERDQYAKGYADGKADAAPKWIPVSERLPQNDQLVLCFMKDKSFGTFRVFHWNYIDWQWNDGNEWYDEHDVTHWMPLPQPPKEES